MMLEYKSYNETLSLDCPGCHTDCPVSINGRDATATATVQSDQLVLRSRDWGNYGTVCCGDMSDRQDCYKVCPLHTGNYPLL